MCGVRMCFYFVLVGDNGDAIFFIRTGEMEVCVGELETVVQTCCAGDAIGEE